MGKGKGGRGGTTKLTRQQHTPTSLYAIHLKPFFTPLQFPLFHLSYCFQPAFPSFFYTLAAIPLPCYSLAPFFLFKASALFFYLPIIFHPCHTYFALSQSPLSLQTPLSFAFSSSCSICPCHKLFLIFSPQFHCLQHLL